MKRLGEGGATSLFGILLLGVMLLGATGLLYAARNDAEAVRRYESEVRLRLAAESAVERVATSFESGGDWEHMKLEDLPEKAERREWQTECLEEDVACTVYLYREEQELVLSATAERVAKGGRFPSIPEYQRVRAHLKKAGDHYVWLGWIP